MERRLATGLRNRYAAWFQGFVPAGRAGGAVGPGEPMPTLASGEDGIGSLPRPPRRGAGQPRASKTPWLFGLTGWFGSSHPRRSEPAFP